MRLISLCGVLLFGAIGEVLAAQDNAPPLAAKNTIESLYKAIDVDLRGVTVLEAMSNLSKQGQISIVLDNDVSSLGDRKVRVRASSEPLGMALDRLAGRIGCDMRIRGDGVVVLVKDPQGSTFAPDWIDDATPVRVLSLNGQHRRLPPPGDWLDPNAVIPADQLPAATAKTIDSAALIAGLVNRIEAQAVASQNPPSAALIAWLKAHPNARTEVWLAVDPHFDDIPKALAILDQLLTDDPKHLDELIHLAIATAVVHDSDDAVTSSRYQMLWGVKSSQFGPTMSWKDIWDYFSASKPAVKFMFDPRKLAWPLLVNQVDLAISESELTWAQQQSGSNGKADLSAFYAQVPYDYSKLNGTGTALGDSPYILANLKAKGGVCVDQAYFAAQMAKVLGVPSLRCGGHGRYGGVGHAWAGYLGADAKSGAAVLNFTGRYQFDNYYTGTTFDPQRRIEVKDRDMELLYAGMSGQKYQAFRDASALVRLGLAQETAHPEVARLIIKEALTKNPYVGAGWRAALRLAAPTEVEKTWTQLAKSLPAFPDVVCDGLLVAIERLGSVDTSVKDKAKDPFVLRTKLFDICAKICAQAKRPDLLIQIRMAQIEELAAAKRDKQVIQIAFDTLLPNVSEGTLVMPLVKRVVELSQQFASDPSFKMGEVRAAFARLEKDFPKNRGDQESPAWVEWQELVKQLSQTNK